jgi:hypothetical protein
MRFFIGALALAVICVIFGSPAAFVLGWVSLSAGDRHTTGKSTKDRAPAVSTKDGSSIDRGEREGRFG